MRDETESANAMSVLTSKIFSSLTTPLVLLLCGCNQDVTPGEPESRPELIIRDMRLAAQNDTDAIQRVMYNSSIVNDDVNFMKWADRLSRLGVADGFEKGAIVRIQVAKKLSPDDPERLFLLKEALVFAKKSVISSENEPKSYWRSRANISLLEKYIAEAELSMDKKYGVLQKIASTEHESSSKE